MPSKGVQCYSYNAVPGCQVEFSVPGQTLTKTGLQEFTSDHLEVDKKNLSGAFNFSGIFRFRVTDHGNELINRWVQINVLTGNLESGNMKATEDQTAVITNNVIVTYTFYDAPNNGEAGLTKWDQCTVAVSPNYSNWMSTLAVPRSPVASQPFTRFVLPAAHDIGMNSLQNVDAILQHAGSIFLSVLKMNVKVFSDIGSHTADSILDGLAHNIIQSLAVTQKDNLNTILSCGARYFEFRPAYLYDVIRAAKPIPDVLYFMHGPIPGMAYAEFLSGCVDFLLKNPAEIIVFQIRWDGVPTQCARPTADDLNQYLSHAFAPAMGGLQAGSLNDMLTLSIDGLREQNKRLIVLENVDSYSTYDDKGNATLTGDSIIAEFEKLSPSATAGKPFTNLQCQATATNIPDVVAYSAISANASNSCLLATKAMCDNKTMPWIKNNAISQLSHDELVVMMDDFVDGGMCDLARDLSMARLNVSPENQTLRSDAVEHVAVLPTAPTPDSRPKEDTVNRDPKRSAKAKPRLSKRLSKLVGLLPLRSTSS